MPSHDRGTRGVPPAARVFSRLDAGEALLRVEASPARKTSALSLALLILLAVPLFWAANAAGVIGDVPSAVAKGKSGGVADDDDERLGPGDELDDDDRTFLRTDDTSGNRFSTRGTTRDRDTTTNTRGGTNDTSRNRFSTRGTTRDRDTRSNTRNSGTRTRGPGTGTNATTSRGGGTQTRTGAGPGGGTN